MNNKEMFDVGKRSVTWMETNYLNRMTSTVFRINRMLHETKNDGLFFNAAAIPLHYPLHQKKSPCIFDKFDDLHIAEEELNTDDWI